MSEPIPESAVQPEGERPSQRTTKIILIVLTIIYAIGLVGALMLSSVSPLIFDAPNSHEDPTAWASFIIFCTCPIIFIIAIAGGWVSYRKGKYRLALGLASLPVIEGILVLFSDQIVSNLL